MGFVNFKLFAKVGLSIWALMATHLLSAQDWQPLQMQFAQSELLKSYYYGFSLYDLDSNRFILGINEGNHFTPASNTKVFTLHSALKNIGDSIPGIHYVERGDSLIFWGTGDPTFLHPKLHTHRVYDLLKNTNKALYYAADKSADEPFYRNGWAIEDYQEYYQPEISSFPIYGNVVSFQGSSNGLRAQPEYFQQRLSVKDQPGQSFSLTRDFVSNDFYMGGLQVPRSYRQTKPFKYSDELFVELLSDTLRRKIELIALAKPDDYHTLYSSATRDVLREMMLPSDNFLAEQISMLAAMQRLQGFKTDSLRKYMDKHHYASFTDKVSLRDASGLSAYNKVTPRSMVELLILVEQEVADKVAADPVVAAMLEADRKIYKDSQLHHLFPAGGVDGTLKTAYALDNGEPFVWAKTGTIHAVHGQSGYLRTRSGRNLVFSFLNNNFLGSATPVRKEMVRIITFIRQNY